MIPHFKFSPLKSLQHNDKHVLQEIYWVAHPRFIFLKQVARNGRLLDLGAGEGGAVFWKDYLRPSRNDIKMCAIDVAKGQFFDRYDDYQIVNLDTGRIKYADDTFDAVLASHIFEHLLDLDATLGILFSLLKQGGRIYIEMPSSRTLDYPPRDQFLREGFPVSTTNFFDDHSHTKTYTLKELSEMLEKHRFRIVQQGIINNRFLEDELITYGIRENDSEIATYGVWSKLDWAQYVVAEK